MATRDPHRFQRLRDLFHAALDLPEAGRDAMLAEACADDAEMLQEVRRLLDTSPDDDEALLTAPARAVGVAPGRRIDRYRIVRSLGRGGMGEVYLAERDAGDFAQTVALKLICDGTAPYASRFQRERSILARLSHPNIAHLVDGGLTEQGQLWFAMEYVEGQHLTAWCDHHRLDTAARVRLFLRLCSAVAFAHANLVVHRDIKPANVLVDGNGEPKLLDFGIAKLLADADTAAQQTQTLAMTPAYASPEQRRGEPANVACDVYQLGLVLYELLTGLSVHSVRGGPDRAPPAMSTALTRQAPDQQTTIARARDSTPALLGAQLRGDLERIVRKALAEEAIERYDSAQALGDDLRRWLEHRPVRAHRGSLGYRLRKFARRNWAATAATGLLLLVTVAYLMQLRVQVQRTAQERDRAEAIAGFMQDLFSASDPRVNLAAESTVRDALALGAQRLRATRDLDAVTHARLLQTVARAYQSVALYGEAAALYQQAQERLAGRSESDARVEQARALAGHAYNDLEAGDTGSTAQQVTQAQQLLAQLPETQSLARAYALTAAAVAHENAGHSETADPLFEQLHDLQPTLMAGDPKLAGDVLLLHGSSLYFRRDLDRAQSILSEAAAFYRREFGDHYPDYGRALAQLGNPQAASGRFEDAERNLLQGIAVMTESLGQRHRDVGNARNDLARLYLRLGRFDEAEPLLLSAHDLIVETYGNAHSYVAAPLINLGFVAYGQQRLELAEQRFRDALALALRDESTPLFRLRAGQGLARVRCARGEHEAGLAVLRQSRADVQQLLPDRIAEADWLVAECLVAAGRADEARQLLATALPALVAQSGEAVWETRRAQSAWQSLQ